MGISSRVIEVCGEGLFREVRYLEIRKNLRDESHIGSERWGLGGGLRASET